MTKPKSKRPSVTFAELVAKATNRGPDKPPIPLRLVAESIGISRQHLYNLLRGEQTASDWVEGRVAKAFGVSLVTVRKALAATREVAKLI